MATITQLQYIVSVHQEGHFGRAAAACFVSQPSLSAQIQKLEDELNIILFDRNQKPIVATPIGLELIKQAEVILREHRKLLQIPNMNANKPQGVFKLGVIPTLSPYLLPLFLADYSARFPDVTLVVNELQTDEILNHLHQDKIDAGLLITPLHNENFSEVHLFYESFFAYVSANHPLKQRKFLTESDLDTMSLWLLEEGHCFRNQALKICSSNRKNRPHGNIEFTGGNLETLKGLVRKSNGYTLLPELALLEMSKKERETHVKKFRKPVPTREVSLVHNKSFYKGIILNSIQDTILNSLPPNIIHSKKSDIDVVEIF